MKTHRVEPDGVFVPHTEAEHNDLYDADWLVYWTCGGLALALVLFAWWMLS